jgi:hypothetical protein
MDAIDEYDRLGQDEFLGKYGFDRARSYLLILNSKAYDSKSIVGVAHGFLPGERALSARDFSGGEATVGRRRPIRGHRTSPRHAERRVLRHQGAVPARG